MRPAALIACAVGTLLGACREAPPLPERPTTLATYPRAMDRLARLMREEFAAPDPAAVEQQIRCENARVARVLGSDFRRRSIALQDSLRSEFSSEQLNELGQRLAHASTSSGDAGTCRALDAAAEVEAPLAQGAARAVPPIPAATP